MIKSELREVQFEVRETTVEILALSPLYARPMFSLEDGHVWVSNGSMWKKQSQKEDQFLDFPLGMVTPSFLTESQFQIEIATLRGVINPSGNPDTTWVLCDGRAILASDYNVLTGNATIPDMRGAVPRMKDNGRGLNPDGDLALGQYQGDTYLSHSHGQRTVIDTVQRMASVEAWTRGKWGDPTQNSNQYVGAGISNTSAGDSLYTRYQRVYTDASGGNETRSKSVTINYFIKINRTVL